MRTLATNETPHAIRKLFIVKGKIDVIDYFPIALVYGVALVP